MQVFSSGSEQGLFPRWVICKGINANSHYNGTVKYFSLLFLALSLTACGSPTTPEAADTFVSTHTALPAPEIRVTLPPATDTPANRGEPFTAEQRLIADQIISVFENDTPMIQYAYAEALGDGRGITAGRAGFTSATGDMLIVVQRYTARVPDNPLAPYIPRLEELAANEDGSLAGLEGLEAKWAECTEDETFRQVQDEVVDEVYYLPAVRRFEAIGARYPITLLNLYDAIIQHGEGEDADGLPALMERTTQHVGGTPRDGVDEVAWLTEFLQVRRADLLNPNNADTQAEWSDSVGRVDALIALSEQGNYELTPPVLINPWGDAHTLPGE